jgi:two-component system, NarL family, response regulator NreC
MNISILIADDHGVLLAGLRALLSAEADMQVVGQASNGVEALRLATQLQPDVVLADINMPGASGIELARQLGGRAPQIRVLILTMYEDPNLIAQAMRAGARGYIAKRAVESELIDGVRAVARGEIYIQSQLRESELEGANPGRQAAPTGAGAQGDLADFSDQERELLALMATGATSHEAAEALGLDRAELEKLRNSLGDKLGLHSRVAWARFAREHGLI